MSMMMINRFERCIFLCIAYIIYLLLRTNVNSEIKLHENLNKNNKIMMKSENIKYNIYTLYVVCFISMKTGA